MNSDQITIKGFGGVEYLMSSRSYQLACEGAALNETLEARLWDSERRDSPYSTVADPYTDDDYCEGCDSTVDYSTDTVHGTCNCEGI
jgi:hypothetical protein